MTHAVREALSYVFLDKIKVKHKEYEDLESPIFNSECICVINKILGEEKSQEDIIKLKEREKNRLERLTLPIANVKSPV